MDDRFLNELRADPPSGFARDLRGRLREAEERRGLARGMAPTLAVALAVALGVVVFTVPSVRVSAQAMLDLFRVRRFAAVEFDPARLEKLKGNLSGERILVFDKVETLKDPPPPQAYPSAEAAGTAIGLQVRRPGFLPNGFAPDSVFVQGAGQARLGVSEAKLRELLRQLDLHDVEVPSGLDGRWVEVRKPPVVVQTFKAGARKVGLVQAVSPEVSVPAGLDVVRLAEVGLRVLGLDADEARRIARSTDWRSTFLVPVPINASTFRPVTIHGEQGLLISTSAAAGDGKRHWDGNVLMWSEDERVFAIVGKVDSGDLVQMAESVQ